MTLSPQAQYLILKLKEALPETVAYSTQEDAQAGVLWVFMRYSWQEENMDTIHKQSFFKDLSSLGEIKDNQLWVYLFQTPIGISFSNTEDSYGYFSQDKISLTIPFELGLENNVPYDKIDQVISRLEKEILSTRTAINFIVKNLQKES